MKMRSQAICWILPFLICTGVCRSFGAQRPLASEVRLGATLSAEDVVNEMIRRNLQRSEALNGFEATRIYRIEYHGFPGSRSAEMVVDVKYKSPATKEFIVRSSTGSRLLIDRVLQKLLQSEREALSPENQSRVALNHQNYDFILEGQETTPDGLFYVLSVEPRTDNKLLYRGRIWVDAKDFAVARIEAAPAKNPSFWIKDVKIEHIYRKVDGFWLPASNRSTSTTRLGGRALLTIEYKDYQVAAARTGSDSTGTVARRQ
jgi:outer membrane lipoprotein-sorting protein